MAGSPSFLDVPAHVRHSQHPGHKPARAPTPAPHTRLKAPLSVSTAKNMLAKAFGLFYNHDINFDSLSQ